MFDFKNLNHRLLLINIVIFLMAFLFNDPFNFFESSYETSAKLIDVPLSSDFDQIKIIGKDGANINLKKTNTGWNILDEKNNLEYSADASKINKSIERILECRKYYEVTNKPEKFKEFGVDDSSILVEFNQKEKTYSVYVGNQGSSYNTTLVRLKNDNTVYSVRGNLTSDWNQNIDYFRNKKLFAFTRENIKNINVSGPRIIELEAGNNDAWHMKQRGLNVETNPTKINRFLDDLTLLEGIIFHAGNQIGYSYGNIKVILKSNIEFNLEIRKVGTDYIVKSESNPYWQTLPEYRVNNLFPNPEDLTADSGLNK